MNKILSFLVWSVCVIACLHSVDVSAQVRRKRAAHASGKPDDSFSKTQVYLGMRGGFSLTAAKVQDRYSSFASTSDPSKTYDKSYSNYSKPGAFVGLEFSFFMKGFTLSFQPNYRRELFSYSNQYEWTDSSDPANYLQLRYNQEIRLDYIELPLFVRYDILRGPLRPFVQVGFYYGMLNSATKHLVVEGTDHTYGASRDFTQTDEVTGAREQFIKSSMGAAFGAGVSYKLGNVRLILDATYRMGLNNITNAQNRYTSNPLAATGDVMDDIKLNNIGISFGVLFPMKFLTSPSFKAVD